MGIEPLDGGLHLRRLFLVAQRDCDQQRAFDAFTVRFRLLRRDRTDQPLPVGGETCLQGGM